MKQWGYITDLLPPLYHKFYQIFISYRSIRGIVCYHSQCLVTTFSPLLLETPDLRECWIYEGRDLDVFFTDCSIKCENLGDVLRTIKASRDIPSFSSSLKMRSDVIRDTDDTNTCLAHRDWVNRMLQCCTVVILNLSPTELYYAILEHTHWIRTRLA